MILLRGAVILCANKQCYPCISATRVPSKEACHDFPARPTVFHKHIVECQYKCCPADSELAVSNGSKCFPLLSIILYRLAVNKNNQTVVVVNATVSKLEINFQATSPRLNSWITWRTTEQYPTPCSTFVELVEHL